MSALLADTYIINMHVINLLHNSHNSVIILIIKMKFICIKSHQQVLDGVFQSTMHPQESKHLSHQS